MPIASKNTQPDAAASTLPGITVLLVTSQVSQATSVRRMLETSTQPYRLVYMQSTDDAIECLQDPHQIDVIISDSTPPKAYDTPKLKHLHQLTAVLPLIYFTSTDDEAAAVNALQNGAQDYLVTGHFDADTLRRAIRYAIERKKYQTEVDRTRKRARMLRQKTTVLKQQSEQLYVLNKAKDDFISLASHQLRTPATGVKQYLGLLLEGYAGTIGQQQREFLELAYDSNERQLKIVSDLLRTAQLDAGHVTLQLGHINLAKLIKSIVEEQYVQVRARDQQVHLQIPEDLQPIKADGGKLRMALENLIDNASKYTLHGKQIYVSIAQAKQGVTTITIRDEGVGIHETDRQKIFDKFARISNVLSDHVGGSGLGLYWVRQIVTLHGGTITVDSTPGQGTSFVVELPGGKI